MYLDFKDKGKLPKGTLIRLFVGDRYSNDDLVNIYNYKESTKELSSIKKDIIVKDGYIEFEIEECSEYFVTQSNITAVKETKSNQINIFIIISIIELIILIVIIILDYLKINPISKLRKEKQIVNEVQMVQPQTNTLQTTTTPTPEIPVNNNYPNNGAI